MLWIHGIKQLNNKPKHQKMLHSGVKVTVKISVWKFSACQKILLRFFKTLRKRWLRTRKHLNNCISSMHAQKIHVSYLVLQYIYCLLNFYHRFHNNLQRIDLQYHSIYKAIIKLSISCIHTVENFGVNSNTLQVCWINMSFYFNSYLAFIHWGVDRESTQSILFFWFDKNLNTMMDDACSSHSNIVIVNR